MIHSQNPEIRSLNEGELDSVNGGALLFIVCFVIGVIAGAAKEEADSKRKQ